MVIVEQYLSNSHFQEISDHYILCISYIIYQLLIVEFVRDRHEFNTRFLMDIVHIIVYHILGL